MIEKVNVTFTNGTTITIEGDEGLFDRVKKQTLDDEIYCEDGLYLHTLHIEALRRLK